MSQPAYNKEDLKTQLEQEIIIKIEQNETEINRLLWYLNELKQYYKKIEINSKVINIEDVVSLLIQNGNGVKEIKDKIKTENYDKNDLDKLEDNLKTILALNIILGGNVKPEPIIFKFDGPASDITIKKPVVKEDLFVNNRETFMNKKEKALFELAKKILDIANNHPKEILESSMNKLYDYLTDRSARVDDKEREWIRKNNLHPLYGDKLMQMESNIVKNGGFISIDSGWYYIYPPKEAKKYYVKENYRELSITYKEYASFFPKSRTNLELWNEILVFLDSVVEIYVELIKLIEDRKDYIQLKIPSDIWTFIDHQDNIVIHFYKKDTGKYVRAIVERIFKKNGLIIDRNPYRVKSGFDVKGKDAKGGTISESHTSLISYLIAIQLKELYDKGKLIGMTESDLVRWLKEKIIEVNSYDVEKAYKALPV